MKKFSTIFSLLLLLVIAGCNKGGTITTAESDVDKIAEDKTALTISGDLNNVTSDLVLPRSGENGTTITWESSNTDVITNEGSVTPSVEGDATILLTATLTLNDETDTKEFTIVVKQSDGAICPGIDDPSDNEVANSGFESGDLCGWTATGDAFSDDYVLDVDTFWSGDSYNKDGSYLFTSNDHESETGTLTSTTFELGGSGWISFKLGAAKHTDQLYMSIMNSNETVDTSDDTEVIRYGNTEFDDNLFTANLAQYKADLSTSLGESLYIQIIDNATTDWAWISMDSFVMYYENESDLPDGAVLAEDITPQDIVCDATAPSAYQIINGGFDTGNICGWTATGEAFTHSDIGDTGITWGDDTYAPEDGYLYSSWKNSNEAKTGTLTSSTFELGGTGYITFRLGGAKPKTNINEANYISIYKADGTEVTRYMNEEFADSPAIYTYKADLSDLIGESLYIQIVDNATADWGTFFMDSFNTYYDDIANLPQGAVETVNLIAPDTTAPVISGTHDFSLKIDATEPNWLTDVTATDDVDGDITVTVDASGVDLTTVGTYSLIYTATDLSNNTDSVIVTVTVTSDDTVDPVISGNQDEIYVVINTTEPNWLNGVSANDNTDGDITSNIAVDKGGFAIDTLGTYTITYSVSDTTTNNVSETTTVYVVSTLPTIENGGFETGDLTGWTADGEAFAASGITNDGENNSVGYYFKPWNVGGEDTTGTLTSSLFNLSGSGYITFNIGAAKHHDEIYVSIYKEDGSEIARYANINFDDSGNVKLYRADLTDYLGENLYIKVVDNATSDWALIVLDEFNTYYKSTNNLPQDASEAVNMLDYTADSTYEIINSGFDSGNLIGWTATGEAFTDAGVTYNSISWDGETSVPENGFMFQTWSQGGEETIGTLTSSTFELGGTGWISFKLGGAKNTDLAYISIYLEDGTEVGRYGNTDLVAGQEPILHQYKVDLSAYLGQNLYIQIVDNATSDWAIVNADSFNTYYENEADVPEATLATNLITL